MQPFRTGCKLSGARQIKPYSAVRQGLIRKEQILNQIPTGMQGYVYNPRRPIFLDRRVRHALVYGFDFEWANTHLFYGAYTRTKSYFSNSALAASGLPSAKELEILEPFRGQVPREAFTMEYQPPTTDGLGGIRDNLLTTLAMLREAGWVVNDMKLVNERIGKPFQFEILLADWSFERVTLPLVKNLERLGIVARAELNGKQARD
ncbi:MAG: ABC transporter substrate-binding protein [Candidatus Binatia bacterium]